MFLPLFDVKYVFRQLRKAPGFTATAVLMLAFGIGATTAIFSIVEGVILRPLPFPNSDRLVVLGDRLKGVDLGGSEEAGVTAPDIRAYAHDTYSFDGLGGFDNTGFELSGLSAPAQINAARLSAGVFAALQVRPLLGRTFTREEDEHNQQVAVLSYATWQSRFNGNPQILGTKLLLDRKPYVVIGVMPRNFEFPLVPGHLNRCELWVPMSLTPVELTQGAASWNYAMVGRLKPGVTAMQAQSDAERVARQIMLAYPPFMKSLHISAVVRPLQEETVEHARPVIRTLFLAVGVVLLIACANLAGLMLVRAIHRQREIAVRLALGARASTLLAQTIFESLVLSVSGGILGLALAAVAVRAGKSLLPESLPRLDEISLNWPVVAFALGLAIVTGVLCGLAPAFAALRTDTNHTLKEGGRTGSAGGLHTRLRSALVVGEIAIALLLLTSSGLLLRSFEKMRDVDLGYRPSHITTAAYSLPQRQYSKQSSIDFFNKELLRRLRSTPGVEAAGMTTLLPASGSNSNETFVVDGYVPPAGAKMNLATPMIVMGDYFRAMGIPLVRGRLFTEADRANTQLVVIVSHKFANHYWPGQSPLGKRIRIGTQEMQTPWLTVVGEVADVKLHSPDADTQDEFYQVEDQQEASIGGLGTPSDLNGNGGYIVLRSALAAEHMENALRATVRSLDPQLALTQVQTMEHAISDTEAPRRFNTILITSFALAAVLLALLGIYSVIAFSVASRAQELAIRMALGSQRSGIMRLILISGSKLAIGGCVIGLACAAAASGLLRSFLFGVSPFDLPVLILVAAAIFLLALAASAIPARRAAALDPMQALRAE